MLDARLALAESLYEPCALGADIGTDHGMLPAALLRDGVCRRMVVSDISPKALARGEARLARLGLLDRVSLRCGDGLRVLTEPCGCVSVTGMGGRTIREMLRRDRDRLRGAVLVLSAHTDLPLVRRGVQEIGYRITRECLCRCRGRFYILWRAEPGEQTWTEAEIRRGGLLWQSASPELEAYAAHCLTVARQREQGQQGQAAEELAEDIRFYAEDWRNIAHAAEQGHL